MTKFAGRTILVVEDEVLIALDLVKSIEDAGGRAVAASTAKAGLALIQSTGISAAVVDRKLGDEDSANLCERLSAAEIPFVIYTGYPDASNAWPHAPFLSKPTRPQDILAAMRVCCRMCAPMCLENHANVIGPPRVIRRRKFARNASGICVASAVGQGYD